MKKRSLFSAVSFVLTILVVLLVVFVAKGRGGREEKFDPSLVVKAARGDLEISVVELGRIEPREKVGVKSRVPGQVLKLFVEEGDAVKKGQLLLVLDPIDFQRDVVRAGQEVEKAQAAVEFAALTLDRRKRGLAERGVAQADVDFAENDLKTKKILLSQARESLALAEDKLRFSRISAPMDGTVTQRTIRVGETVVPGSMATLDGTALLTLSDLSVLIAKADLNQIDVAKVHLGQPVTLTLDALPGKSFTAKVTKIAPASILPKGKDVEVFPIEATLDAAGPGSSGIRPGMTADVKIHVETRRGVLKLPIEAVVKEKGKTFVHKVMDGEGRKPHTVKADVKIGGRNDREQEITGGLSEGDRVLIKPPSAEANEFK
jgi:HlyD family secretion protein/macrolide-specific efflux system membrane fusion protein